MKAADHLPVGLSTNEFCKRMELSKSSLYYKHKGESESNIKIMNMIDKIFLDHPTFGHRKIRDSLRLMGYNVNHKRVRRLMEVMRLEAIYPQKSLSKNTNATYVHPYLLRNLQVSQPNQVWSTDITYVAMPNGFMYLYAIIDVYSRYILGWRLSNTLTIDNCLELMSECVGRHGAPKIVNTDQGSQYTSPQWESLLTSHGIQISMDGRGRCKDNIWIERFWRTIKQDYIYLNPTDDVSELRKGIARYMDFYNLERPHQSLAGVPPVKYFSHAA